MLRRLLRVVLLFAAVGYTATATPVLFSRTVNPNVTPSTITQAVCVPGYTKLVRTAASFTNGVKLKLVRERHEPPENAALYELDHVVPLILGGHPRSLNNLRLQPWDEARRKDRLEVKLGCLVCSRQVGLSEA